MPAPIIQDCAIVVLAAGASRRLGQSKQLLPLGHTTLIHHTVQLAISSGCHLVVVVAGQQQQAVEAALQGLPIRLLHNAGWQEGMASSVRLGLQHLRAHFPLVQKVIFMVCDQPFVNKKHLVCLIGAQQSSGKGIVASAYAGKLGTPALFTAAYFDALLQLRGDTGARILLQQYAHDIAEVPFARGAIDIDTMEDYNELLYQWKQAYDS
jgi:molybdenum cofactor cytidylyltransferase